MRAKRSVTTLFSDSALYSYESHYCWDVISKAVDCKFKLRVVVQAFLILSSLRCSRGRDRGLPSHLKLAA